MSEYVLIVKHDKFFTKDQETGLVKSGNKTNFYIAKRSPGRQERFTIVSDFTNEADAQFALDALNEKHNFEYVTNKDSEAK